MTLLQQIKGRLLRPAGLPDLQAGPPAPGLYHYRREGEQEKSRLHLRVDGDGSGLLMVNASRVFQLNPSAAHMAYLRLQDLPDSQALAALRKTYRARPEQIQADYARLSAQLEELARPDGACPVCELELETTLPFTARPSAPYRMDLALTYRCNNNCRHCYNARPRRGPELSTAEWKNILDRLWDLRIPHVVFTGGEPTLRDDLAELICHAESNGQITGINTNGRRLAQPGYVESLVEAGLDHVQITLESHDPAIHNRMTAAPAWEETTAGIRRALASPLFVMTNTTLLQDNCAVIGETLQFLADLGVPTIGLNALIHSGRGASVNTGLPEKDLQPILRLAREFTARSGQKLIWYTPTEYCHFDPVEMNLGVKGCTAALYNMCIEPDGSVIPCQSYYSPVGNLLADAWEGIWNHPLCLDLRERRNLPEACKPCSFLAECGGGCPLSRQPSATTIFPSEIPMES